MKVASACPNCGKVDQRDVYDIGSGPELSCANCEWCWGADGQDLRPLDVAKILELALERVQAAVSESASELASESASESASEIDLTCPTCGRVNETSKGLGAPEPVDGDASMCWQCGSLAIFVGTPCTHLRAPTNEELLELMDNAEVRALRESIKATATPSQAVLRARLELESEA